MFACCGLLSELDLAPEGVFYEYEPLPSKTSIRLISFADGDLDLENHAYDLGEALAYAALSYVWGDSTLTWFVFCDGKRIPATVNLAQILRRLHTRGSDSWDVLDEDRVKYFWVDALCINQEDDKEKAQQVKMMASIYESAQSVLIWLVESYKEIGLAVELIDNMPKQASGFRDSVSD